MPPVGSEVAKLLFLSALIVLPAEIRAGLSCLSNPCLHGVCIDNLNSTHFCYCIDGYTGTQCQTDWDECWSSPCLNGGVCVDGVASFNCSCPPGFVGDRCQEDFDECQSDPCQNNGTCRDAPNGYTCSCWPGFSGVHCEIDAAVCNATNETRCANAGICVEGPGERFTCTCRPGWEGLLCDLDTDECASSPCQNGGVCLNLIADYTCACAFGYAGRNCEDPVRICEVNSCSNGALCLIEDGEDVCYCVPDFHGDFCQFQYDECQIGRNECKNGGTCIDGIDNTTCVCPPSLTGTRCECLVLIDDELDCTYIRPTTPEVVSSTKITESTTAKSSTTVVASATEEMTTTEMAITTPKTIVTVATESSTFSFTTTGVGTTFEEVPSSTATEETTFMTTVTTTEEPLEMTASTTKEELITTLTMTETPSSTDISTSRTDFIPVTSTAGTTFVLTDSSSESTVESEGTTYSTAIPITETTLEVVEMTTQFSMTPTAEIILSSSPKGRESNITFSSVEETTLFSSSSISPFFTKEPEVTTRDFPETSTLSSFDCSKSHDLCQNGGTCTFTAEIGYRCVCPFDTEGHFCQVQMGVKKAAFVGESYLSHRLEGASNMTIEFSAKSLATEGLWFYASVEEAYMALYTENGYLKFKFSCGYQTMLLSELKVPVNTGFLMKVRAVMEFSKDLKHCDASIRVNESLAMAGDQIAILNRLSRPIAWLHLGGVPEDFTNSNLPNGGFVGCLMGLKILGKKVDIFKDADDGFGVTECSSLACLSNPCSNGASCHSKGDEWSCSCKSGFLGKMCEISVCENNPCLFGGTCIPFSGSGYICLCPFGKHGHFCENDLKVTEPNFSSTIRGLSSYVAYAVPGGFSEETMEIQFKFAPTTLDQISILLFIGQRGHHDFYSDHMAVSFVKGYIMLTWNLGSGPRRIFTSQAIKPGERDYSVRLGRTGRRAWLFVENLGNVTGRAPGYLVHLDVMPVLYLGGHYSRNFSTLPHDLPLHTGFSGCIFDVKLVSDSVVIPLMQGSRQTTGRAIGQCGTTECHEQSCQNNGACLHHGSTFMCLCQDNWFGPLCTSRRNPCDHSVHKCGEGATCVPVISDYECDCPPGKSGKFCEISEDITDVGFSGRRSYLAINSGEFENNHFNVEFELRPLGDNGLIVFFGRKSTGFLSLSLEDGLLDLRLSPSENRLLLRENDPTTILSSKLLIKGIWYKIRFGVFGKKAYLSVDDVISSKILSTERGINLSRENIFIGGVPDLSSLPQTAISTVPVSFKGCVRRFFFDSVRIPLTKSNILSGRNINDCDGTPCGKDACLNGGNCWLDSFLKPHCSCVGPYYGNKCQLIPDCHDELLCKNTGTCDKSKCFCKVGFGGAFCENEIRVTTPEFTGKSYLLMRNEKIIKRDVGGIINLKNLYLNFTTVKKNGLLIWSRRSAANTFLGIGLENGFLKIAYFNPDVDKFGNKTLIDVPSYHHISDGLWHTLEIRFTPFIVTLDQNNKLPIKGSVFRTSSNLSFPIDGFLYIGGVPTKLSSVWKETNGIFTESFAGCIESFAINEGKIIKDFTNFEGADVDICSIF